MVGCCEHCNEPTGSIKGRGFIDYHGNYYFIKVRFAAWSVVILQCSYHILNNRPLLQACYRACVTAWKELLVYCNDECRSEIKYKILLWGNLQAFAAACLKSQFFGDATRCLWIWYRRFGTVKLSRNVGDPSPSPVTQRYMPEERRTGSIIVWRLEECVKYNQLTLHVIMCCYCKLQNSL